MTALTYIAIYFTVGATAVMLLNLFSDPWPSAFMSDKGKPSDGWWAFSVTLFLLWPLVAPFAGAIALGCHVRQSIKDGAERAFGGDE